MTNMYGSTAKGRKDVSAFSFQLWMGLAALAFIHTSAYIAIYLELGKQNLMNFLSSFATLKPPKCTMIDRMNFLKIFQEK
jgi:hypothetical protein